jgi:hypothetical protein
MVLVKFEQKHPHQRPVPTRVHEDFVNLHLFNYSNNYSALDESSFCSQLDHKTKTEVALHVFNGIKTRFSCFFCGLDLDFQVFIVKNWECKVFLPRELILSSQTQSPGIYFIYEGSVGFRKGANCSEKGIQAHETMALHLRRGSYFGEDFLLSKLPVLDVLNTNKKDQVKTFFISASKIASFFQKNSDSKRVKSTIDQLRIITFKRRTFFQKVPLCISLVKMYLAKRRN